MGAKRKDKAKAKKHKGSPTSSEDEEHSESASHEEEKNSGSVDASIEDIGLLKKPIILELTLPSNEKEVILNYELRFKEGKALSVCDIVQDIKKYGFPIENSFISYYNPLFQSYVNCGLDPLTQNIKLYFDELLSEHKL